ncbi:hypothetical protein GGI12_001879 [Dipsacomyces acuminosporus]|nr:hypothetical protein GGI12_001879 [Dipsacomyces acuminosporus]
MGNERVASGKVTKNSKPAQAKKAKASKNSEIDDIFAAKPTSSKPKATSEIDDIFTKKAQQPKPQQAEETKDKFAQKKPKPVTVVDATAADRISSVQQKQPPPKDDNFADSRGKQSKYTDDGLRVFYMDDLHIGEGEGDTELCPFDCDCCF